jgi:hypothetical protein
MRCIPSHALFALSLQFPRPERLESMASSILLVLVATLIAWAARYLLQLQERVVRVRTLETCLQARC